MSDGLSDAHAMDDLASAILVAADRLVTALEEAERGYRGMAINAVATANDILGPRYRLQRKVRDEEWR